MNDFIHLHLHTEYSLSDSTVRINHLIARAVEYKMSALAICDLNNIYAVVKFYKACLKAGIKPIIGAEVWLENPLDPSAHDKFVLLARHYQGYVQLCQLLTGAILYHKSLGVPVIKQHELVDHNDGLIALHHANEGALNTHIKLEEHALAHSALKQYRQIFGDRLYLEITRIGHADEAAYQNQLLVLADGLHIPLVAVNLVQFIEPQDYDAHEVRVCIHDGRQLGDPRRQKKFSRAQYFRSQLEMRELFADLPEAIENTNQIALRCNVFLTFGVDYLPKFPGPDHSSTEQVLKEKAQTGLEQRLSEHAYDAGFVEEDYQSRLKRELGVINEMGFPGYFLIVADFIQWSRDNGVPVGPGRGSGAGSVVAWALKITDIDPLKYGLLFERFLNPERVSMPDFDIDFCMRGRDRVIEYVAECYGRDQVAQIITFGTMAARAVIRDVGRVLGHAYGYVDSIAKLIPFEVGMTLEKAVEQEKELQLRFDEDAEAAELFKMAKQLEGLSRNVGKHAGGVVIAPSKLTHFTALYAESEQTQAVTQFDKDDLESIGLVKFDFLGLRTLTVIDWAVDFANKLNRAAGREEIMLPQQAFEDEKTFELIRKAQTVAVFQLESSGMRSLILRLQPDSFEDLIALVALFRPGPLDSGMVDSYVNRKHGRESVIYPHPDTEAILSETNGVILYQEQVMQIAQVLAGYSLGAADLLRRAMGKKQVEEMAKQRQVFVDGAEMNKINRKTAEYIFDLMETFAGYGFNKSHSAAYALLSFQTAWLKAHFPSSYMAATMSADMDHTDKIVGLIADSRNIGLSIEFPCINRSLFQFEPLDESTIMYGLGAIKGLGESAIEVILQERDLNGAFLDIYDFCQRIVSRKVNKRAMEALIRCGSFDVFTKNRAQLLADLPSAIDMAEQNNDNQNAGQSDLFGISIETVAHQPRVVSPWHEQRLLSEEREALGLYLSGHPFDYYRKELADISDMQRCDSLEKSLPNAVVAGMVVDVRIINTRRGGKMAFANLDEGATRVDVSFFSELYTLCHSLVSKDKILIVTGELKRKDDQQSFEMIAQSVSDMEALREGYLSVIRLELDADQMIEPNLTQLKKILSKHNVQGNVGVEVLAKSEKGPQGLIQLSGSWQLKVNDDLLNNIATIFGKGSVHCLYDKAEIKNGLALQAPLSRFHHDRQASKPSKVVA